MQHNATPIFGVYVTGTVSSANGVFAAFSDIKLKENIVDATPKLEGLKQLRIVNYNLKSSPDQKMLGVIAQEVEQIYPGLIEERPDTDEDGNNLGTTTKLVKYSILTPMLIKGLQELDAKHETLQTKYDALLARVLALESK